MSRRPTRRTRLTVEQLETRETPAGALLLNETFDGRIPGQPPMDWSGWGSNGNAGFSVADGRAVGGRSLASAGGSTHAGRVWAAEQLPANVTATAAVFADSLIPAYVFARGRDLNGPRATYYAASVARGLEVKLFARQWRQHDPNRRTQICNVSQRSLG